MEIMVIDQWNPPTLQKILQIVEAKKIARLALPAYPKTVEECICLAEGMLALQGNTNEVLRKVPIWLEKHSHTKSELLGRILKKMQNGLSTAKKPEWVVDALRDIYFPWVRQLPFRPGELDFYTELVRRGIHITPTLNLRVTRLGNALEEKSKPTDAAMQKRYKPLLELAESKKDLIALVSAAERSTADTEAIRAAAKAQYVKVDLACRAQFGRMARGKVDAAVVAALEAPLIAKWVERRMKEPVTMHWWAQLPREHAEMTTTRDPLAILGRKLFSSFERNKRLQRRKK